MNRLSNLRVMLIVMVLLGSVFPVLAQVEMVLVVDGMEGGSKLVPAGMDIETYMTGVSSTSTGPGGGGAGTTKANFTDISVVKRIDKASPELMEACVTRNPIAAATLFVRKTDGKKEDYLIITLKNVVISSYQSGGSTGGNDLGTETLSLNFGEIIYTTIIDGGPKVEFDWSIEKNLPS